MALEKRGVFFTSISIILVASLIFFYISSNKYSYEDKVSIVEIRVLTMDSFISDIEYDIERGLFISSIRSLIGMSEYMSENGTFLENFTASFEEVMLNGTLNGIVLNITLESNFGDWIEKISDIGEKLDVNVRFRDITIDTFHESPWSIRIVMLGVLDLTDRKGIASWHRPINLSATLNIVDFEDPLYTVTSAGKFSNKIIISNITDFDPTPNLILHANNSWYIESNKAPSFLMRFEGNLSASPFGIESIVNVEDLEVAAPEIYKSDSSSVDYIYLGNLSISNCRVNETKDIINWFRLDYDHLSVYEAECE